jgi:hypothetical protein
MRWTRRIRHTRAPRAGVALLDADARPSATEPAESEAQQVVTLQHLSDVPVGCRVVVLGPARSLGSLATALPPSWTVEHVDEVGDLTVADLVIVAAATPGKVAAVLARQPDASVVALVHPDAGVDAVVELLHSGATACVRSAEADLVAAHLVACARRYPVGAR